MMNTGDFNVWRKLIAVSATSTGIFVLYNSEERRQRIVEGYSLRFDQALTHCEGSSGSVARNIGTSFTTPSRLRQVLASTSVLSLPLPRIPIPNDPDLSLSKRRQNSRARSEKDIQKLHAEIQAAVHSGAENVQEIVGGKLLRSFEILFGSGTTPQSRQDFLQEYGCTGWTENIIEVLLELGSNRGFVEIGAGNGQWARVLSDRYKDSTYASQHNGKKFDFCLAFDNMSALPLDPKVFHNRTKPYHDHFYAKVQTCDSIDTVLKQWQCRGRVLLLVYPSPASSMAADALRAYASMSSVNDTLVYVGEGRGGANANDDFFNALESGSWVLTTIHPVRSFGSKGYEKMFIFTKNKI